MNDIGLVQPEFSRVSQEVTLETEQNEDAIQAISIVEPTTITEESLEIAQNDDAIQDSPLIEPTIITTEGPDTNNGKMLIFYYKIDIYKIRSYSFI